MNARTTTSSALLLIALAGAASASPAIDIRSNPTGPVTPGNAPAGPNIDPTTQQGQWFLENNGTESARSHQFYDNIDGAGGGPPNHLAIQGSFAGYTTFNGQITGYTLNVSITNNTPISNGPYQSQPNTHGENRLTPWPRYVGTMYDVRFCAHWADDGIPLNFQAGSANIPSNNPGPASTSPGTSNTYAMGYDALAWYSYNQPLPGTIIGGSYQVPAWDFGNIAVGQTVTRALTFAFYTPLNIAAVPPPTFFQGQDLLISRSTEVKIGTYFQDDPAIGGIFDRLQPYPPGSFNPQTSQYGNSSVFFNPVPAPGAAAAVAVAGLFAARRRRR
ncbi:MAG: hypothetical protein IBJ11_06635 [Phycisphaerales bacterium]|nr:hypothetical protein [Phycisphaerales bacterium]